MRIVKACALCLTLFSDSAAALSTDTTVRIGGEVFDVAIADDAHERQRGLMFVRQMPANEGMLFIFPDSRPRFFWMKNTLIGLDILYFDEQGQLLNVQNAVPCERDPCGHYPSRGSAHYVLELNHGRAAELGLSAGAQLHVDYGDTKLPPTND